MTLGQIINKYRVEHDMSMGDFAKLSGLSKAYVGFLEKGYSPSSEKPIAPSIKTIKKVAYAMHMDFDVLFSMLDGNVTVNSNDDDEIDNLISKFGNIHHVRKRSFPMLGTVACGKPIMADQQYDSFILADADIDADYCLTASGDSMINARIFDGDIVFVKKQDMVDNGDIAVVIIDDDVTLKRVFYYPETQTLRLQAENPQYKPFVFTGEELEHVHILGKAVFFQSMVR